MLCCVQGVSLPPWGATWPMELALGRAQPHGHRGTAGRGSAQRNRAQVGLRFLLGNRHSKQPLQSVLVLPPNMRSVPNGRNHVPEACTPDTGKRPIRHKKTDPAQKRPARANRTQIESCRSLTRTQSPRLIKQILRIQNKISYAYELLRDGWAQRTISRALQEWYNFVPRHVSRKALNYMHTEYLKIEF